MALAHPHQHAATEFLLELNGKHGEVIRRALDILQKRFAHEATVAGYRKDGPVAVAKFEHGEDDELREAPATRGERSCRPTPGGN